MTLGRIYTWESAPDDAAHDDVAPGRLGLGIVALTCLETADKAARALSGRYVAVENRGEINLPTDHNGEFLARPIGNALPDEKGHFLFDPGRGGGRVDKEDLVNEAYRLRYIEASHFGQVNAYYHVTRIAEYVDGLLGQLGEKPLPRVRVLVNAHHAATQVNGTRDGVLGKKSGRWLPFQGGHYRLSTRNMRTVKEVSPVSPTGEIHLGPGWRLTRDGGLAEFTGRAYRCNASHNAGIIYHEYGHHITRHTADFMANQFKAPHRQSNRKTATDEGVSDYWTAILLDTPHIWCLHRRHDGDWIHPRSLTSNRTMGDFHDQPGADVHANGTILAAALWDIRRALKDQGEPARTCDLLVLEALLNIGRLQDDPYRPSVRRTRALRETFHSFAACVAHADTRLFDRRYGPLMKSVFEARGIALCDETLGRLQRGISVPTWNPESTPAISEAICSTRDRSPDAIIPQDHELLHPSVLEEQLRSTKEGFYHLTAVGDVMLGARARRPIHTHGPDYPFAWVTPIFRRSCIVLANQEGPLARHARRRQRNHAYKVDPKSARILRRAGFHVLNLANNHLLDCGREGVLETIEALTRHGITRIGAGQHKTDAHAPAILRAGAYRVGLLGYYWNRRTAARNTLPGSARDRPEQVESDIRRLRSLVDRVIVTIHWGVPYDRQPSDEDRAKARHFIDCGADVVIGHHPHIIQPVEIYQDRAIFYSLGNFAFGSGNSRAESLLLGVRFKETASEIDVYPVYARNRDPRVNYQPKILCGDAASKTVDLLASLSGDAGHRIENRGFYGRLNLPRQSPNPSRP